MALELAKALIGIRADTSKLAGDLSRVQKTVGLALKSVAVGAGSIIGGVVGALSIKRLHAVSVDAIKSASASIDANVKLANTLRVTGNAAGFTAGQLDIFASRLQASTTIADEEFTELMAVLARFKGVSGDVFKRAVKGAADLAAAGGFGSLTEAGKKMGKALEDPIKGMRSLRRGGILFTKAQEDQIKAMVEANDILSAQEIILANVESRVKGMAEALADTPVGRLKQLNNEIDDIKEDMGEAVLPMFVAFKEIGLEIQKIYAAVFIPASEALAFYVKEFSDAMQIIMGTARAVSDNWDLIWEIFRTSVALTTLRAIELFQNMVESLKTMFVALVMLWGVQVDSWIGFFGRTLNRMIEASKIAFGVIGDLWKAIWTDDSMLDVVKRAQGKIAMITLEGMVDMVKTSKKGVRDFNNAIEGIDLFKSRGPVGEMIADRLKKLMNRLGANLFLRNVPPGEPEAAPAGPEVEVNTRKEGLGRVGFLELGSKIQDALLKGPDDKQDKMITLLEAGNKIQEQQLELEARNGDPRNFGLT